jgi:hypothetical protein
MPVTSMRPAFSIAWKRSISRGLACFSQRSSTSVFSTVQRNAPSLSAERSVRFSAWVMRRSW